MRVIEQGKIDEKQVNCEYCHCKFMVSLGDVKKFEGYHRIFYKTTCPTCKECIVLSDLYKIFVIPEDKK